MTENNTIVLTRNHAFPSISYELEITNIDLQIGICKCEVLTSISVFIIGFNLDEKNLAPVVEISKDSVHFHTLSNSPHY